MNWPIFLAYKRNNSELYLIGKKGSPPVTSGENVGAPRLLKCEQVKDLTKDIFNFHIQLEEKAESQLAIRRNEQGTSHPTYATKHIYSEIRNYKRSDEVTEYI